MRGTTTVFGLIGGAAYEVWRVRRGTILQRLGEGMDRVSERRHPARRNLRVLADTSKKVLGGVSGEGGKERVCGEVVEFSTRLGSTRLPARRVGVVFLEVCISCSVHLDAESALVGLCYMHSVGSACTVKHLPTSLDGVPIAARPIQKKSESLSAHAHVSERARDVRGR